MALADPQSVTVNTTPVSLPRVEFGKSEGVFATADNTTRLRVSHTSGNGGSNRTLVRLEARKIATDPLTSFNKEVTGSVHIVIDMPRVGFTQTEKEHYVKALSAYASSAVITKILGGES